MMENHDEDIFYSDDELSDSELFQVKIMFISLFLFLKLILLISFQPY